MSFFSMLEDVGHFVGNVKDGDWDKVGDQLKNATHDPDVLALAGKAAQALDGVVPGLGTATSAGIGLLGAGTGPSGGGGGGGTGAPPPPPLPNAWGMAGNAANKAKIEAKKKQDAQDAAAVQKDYQNKVKLYGQRLADVMERNAQPTAAEITELVGLGAITPGRAIMLKMQWNVRLTPAEQAKWEGDTGLKYTAPKDAVPSVDASELATATGTAGNGRVWAYVAIGVGGLLLAGAVWWAFFRNGKGA